MDKIPLGEATAYPDSYAPEMLFPVPRQDSRAWYQPDAGLPFHGEDLWNAWELTWLGPGGKPVVAFTPSREEWGEAGQVTPAGQWQQHELMLRVDGVPEPDLSRGTQHLTFVLSAEGGSVLIDDVQARVMACVEGVGEFEEGSGLRRCR